MANALDVEVTDGVGGPGVPGVLVRVEDEATGVQVDSGLTDALGVVALGAGLPNGSYVVLAGKIGWTFNTPIIAPLAGFPLFVPITATAARECFDCWVTSSWVYRVCWLPGLGVAVTFHKHGVPYFCCHYPGTVHADYEAFELQASMGRWVWAQYWKRPYVPLPLGG